MITIHDLEKCFYYAINKNYSYVGVLIEMEGFDSPEIIINSSENFVTKLAYYKSTYDENLNHRHAKGIKIVDCTYGDYFDEIELDLLGENNELTDAELNLIAGLCHTVNQAYCRSTGDHSQPNWDDAPDWQKQSAINGVIFHLENSKTPEQSHENWMKEKLVDGWVYGEVKDPEKKTHPCMVPYDQLPLEQRTKDYLFKSICDFFKGE
jgi:hypothetical protein